MNNNNIKGKGKNSFRAVFRSGFTLVEMLTVVMIISILTAVVLPQYRRAIQKAQATEAIAMLRTIMDSGDRLAAEFGYKTFKSFAAANDSKAVFSRLDMFNEDTIACTVFGRTLDCKHFVYYLNGSDSKYDYISAVKKNTPYKDTEIRLYWGDIPQLACVNPEGSDGCDVYNIGD